MFLLFAMNMKVHDCRWCFAHDDIASRIDRIRIVHESIAADILLGLYNWVHVIMKAPCLAMRRMRACPNRDVWLCLHCEFTNAFEPTDHGTAEGKRPY